MLHCKADFGVRFAPEMGINWTLFISLLRANQGMVLLTKLNSDISLANTQKDWSDYFEGLILWGRAMLSSTRRQ